MSRKYSKNSENSKFCDVITKKYLSDIFEICKDMNIPLYLLTIQVSRELKHEIFHELAKNSSYTKTCRVGINFSEKMLILVFHKGLIN